MIGIGLILASFAWLLYETDWMRISLLVGVYTPVIEQPKRQFTCFKHYHQLVHEIPARTLRLYGFTLNFNKGCNKCRAKLLREVVKVNTKPRKLNKYREVYTPKHYTLGITLLDY